jgi:hypothetical protein
MLIFVWSACGGPARFVGVSDDPGRARQAAEACITSGRASGARVEAALLVSGFAHLTYGYERTGDGWQGNGTDGRVTWRRLTAS